MPERVYPVWMAYLEMPFIRRFSEKPEDVLGGFVKPGMTVLDAGCAMGFYSLAMARLVGPEGRVIAVDLQPGMIKALRRRARRAKVLDRIETRVCPATSLEISDLKECVDFTTAFHVLHEVPDATHFVAEIYAVLKSGAKFYILEPKDHATEENFAATIAAAEAVGFTVVGRPSSKRDRAVILSKPA
jgi:ubiquinone/menaquinone biosynthesis C-methylase UbiE